MANIVDIVKKVFNPSARELRSFQAALNRNLPSKRILEQEILQEYDNPPKIAIIGKTGVGKSSTVNALFNPDPPLAVGHVEATTKEITEKIIFLGGDRGFIIVYDCPGLNESIRENRRIIPLYKQLLGNCDVLLWIVKADDRALSEDQELLLKIVKGNLKDKLVVGINQVDIIQPGEWVEEYNLPSRTQEKSIARKIQDVRKRLAEIDFTPEHIVPYSALRQYRLVNLFRAMLEACPTERAWVLSSREDIAPYDSPILSR